jgi:hypothetical protein
MKPVVRVYEVRLHSHLLANSYVKFSNESGGFDVKGYNNNQDDAKSDRNLWNEEW